MAEEGASWSLSTGVVARILQDLFLDKNFFGKMVNLGLLWIR